VFCIIKFLYWELKMNSFQPATNNLLHTEVINDIIAAIVAGDLKPGDRVIEQYIAQQMKISRSPVREAIRELVAQGILQFEPRKGAYVSPIVPNEIKSTYMLRSRLEGLTARLATDYLTKEDLVILEQNSQQMVEASRVNHAASFVDNDIKFHDFITGHCNHPRLIKMIEGVRIQTRLYMVMSKEYLVAHSQLNRESNAHQPILEAFRLHDCDLVEKRVQEHILAAGEIMLESIVSQGGDTSGGKISRLG
jgi:DNA-binding GntR family transcriptional regulator